MNARELEDLLAEYWERREAGEPVTAEQFAAAHPPVQARLLAALRTMQGAADLLPSATLPERIGDYAVRRRLGRGAYGEVFEVVDATGTLRALKRLLPHAAAAARDRERFRREVHVLRSLRHPGIVGVIDAGDDATTGTPFVVMEFVPGLTLAQWIEHARTAGRDVAAARLAGPGTVWQRIARCGAAIARGLAAAHAAGALHRDLKPGNVLLRADGTPVLVDFGLAADAGAATLTHSGDVLGTPNSMAPEQARGETATVATDVFGAGAVLHELLTLSPPRPGSHALQVLERARREPLHGPRERAAEVPRELDLIARRATAFQPHHRHRSADELAAALDLVAAGGRPIGLTLGWSQQFDELRRRHRRLLVLAAVAVALGAMVWVLQRADRTTRAEAVRLATIDAATCHLDDDERGLTMARARLSTAGRSDLAMEFESPLPDHANAFAKAIAAGIAALPRDGAAAERHFAAASGLRPEAALAIAWHGIAAARANHDEVAERELTSAVRLLPDSVRLRVELGRVLRQRGRIPDALHHLRHATAQPRASLAAFHELAKALLVGHSYDEALVAVDRALALARDRDRIPPLRTKAAILDGAKRRDDAVAMYRELLLTAPSPETWTSLGRCLDSLHRFPEAAAAYQRAVTMAPKRAHALFNLVYLHTGSDDACTECRAWFQAHPEMRSVELAEPFAIALLATDDGLPHLENAAKRLHRNGGGQGLRQAIDTQLQQDLPAEKLGYLLRARRALED